MYVKPEPALPPGVNPPLEMDRKPLLHVVNGDTWLLDFTLRNPKDGTPATPKNTLVTFVLSENKFTKTLWEGEWHSGIEPDPNVEGLVHVKIPQSVSSLLRRGVYAFSVKVSDDLNAIRETQAGGHIQVEYEPTSDLHNIPYRSGT
jgi:hypothetical protein